MLDGPRQSTSFQARSVEAKEGPEGPMAGQVIFLEGSLEDNNAEVQRLVKEHKYVYIGGSDT